LSVVVVVHVQIWNVVCSTTSWYWLTLWWVN